MIISTRDSNIKNDMIANNAITINDDNINIEAKSIIFKKGS